MHIDKKSLLVMYYLAMYHSSAIEKTAYAYINNKYSSISRGVQYITG